MLSPEAELEAIVRSVAESLDPKQGDHLEYRKVRVLLAQTIRTIQAILDENAFEQHTETRERRLNTIKLALIDLDCSTSLTRTGI